MRSFLLLSQIMFLNRHWNYMLNGSKGRAHSGNSHGIQISTHSLAHWKWCDASDRNNMGGYGSALWGPGKCKREENIVKSLSKLLLNAKQNEQYLITAIWEWDGWVTELGRLCFGKTPPGSSARIAVAYCSIYIAVSVWRGLYPLNNTVCSCSDPTLKELMWGE